MARRRTDSSGSRRVGPVSVEHDRHLEAELREHMPANLFEEAFAGRHVAAANEDGRPLQVLGSAREDGPVDQTLDRLGPHGAVAEHFVRPASRATIRSKTLGWGSLSS